MQFGLFQFCHNYNESTFYIDDEKVANALRSQFIKSSGSSNEVSIKIYKGVHTYYYPLFLVIDYVGYITLSLAPFLSLSCLVFIMESFLYCLGV